MVVDIIEKRKRFLKEIQADVTEFLPKDINTEKDGVKPQKMSKSILQNFYSTTKQRSQITDMQRLLSWRENPSDVIKENSDAQPDILDMFGPNINTIKIVEAIGKFRN